MEGYVFCSGIESLNISYRTRQDLQRLIRSVTYLIREAPYRPDYSMDNPGGSNLDICPLGGLLDMYQAQKATKRHDKVYALLSMSSDDLRNAGLSPNYTISWEELFQRLLRHLVPNIISIQTCTNREVAIIKSKGRILGKVVSVQMDPARGDRLRMEVALQETLTPTRATGDWSKYWNIQRSAKTIRNGDYVCIFEGSSKPAIIRLHNDYFTIVVMVAVFSDETLRTRESFDHKISLLSKTHSSKEFLLIWDWEDSLEISEDPEDYEAWIRTRNWPLGQTKLGPKHRLARARRMWNVVLMLEDIVPGWTNSTEHQEMERRGQEILRDCEKAIEAEISAARECEHERSPLWTTQDTYEAVVDLLFTGVDTTSSWNNGVSRVGLLVWAAKGDCRSVVELLLRTGKIDLNILTISELQEWPLYIAVYEGHKTIADLLLKLGKFNMHTMYMAASVLLSLAAERDHEDVLRVLVGAWPEIFGSGNYLGPKPLWVAASKGYEDTVRLLLETTEVELNAKGVHGQTPLSKAAAGGHTAVVELLLSTKEVEPDPKDDNERTPLWLAASEGHTAIVKLLLDTGRVELNSRTHYGESPLSRAVLGGHAAVVNLLLETRKADFRTMDSFSLQTPLSLAAERGHEIIVKSLLEAGSLDVALKDGFSPKSPLTRAKNGGHEAVSQLLIEAVEWDPQRRHLEDMLDRQMELLARTSPFPPPVREHSSGNSRRGGLAKLLKLKRR